MLSSDPRNQLSVVATQTSTDERGEDAGLPTVERNVFIWKKPFDNTKTSSSFVPTETVYRSPGKKGTVKSFIIN